MDTEAAAPLIDEATMADWTSDLDREDVLAILEGVPGQCAACVNEIEAAVGELQLPKAKRVAHRLKGMAANLGAARLSKLARKMEIEAQELGDIERQLPALKTTVTETLAALAARS